MDASAVTSVTSAITTNLATASGIVVTAGLALIGLSFLGFVLRKAMRVSRGQVA